MRVDVAPTPAGLDPAAVGRSTVLVVDVLRASTTIITALANGAAAVVPATSADQARRLAGAHPGALVAGERRGEPLPGFDLGNSPLEVVPARVRDRMIIFTTSNGTRALIAARGGAAVGVAAFVNLTAAAAWTVDGDRDLIVVCAGERGGRSLEDEVCAGLLVARVAAARPAAALTVGAATAAALARRYAADVVRLARDASWARHLAGRGRHRDVAACLAVDTTTVVPVYLGDVDKVVWRCR